MGADASADVFRAISDPTRRRLLDLLRDEERSVNDLVGELAMTQPAVSQHLRILLEVELVSAKREGRRRLYRATPEPLMEIYDWVQHYQRFWSNKLDALGGYLDETAPSPGSVENPKTRRPSRPPTKERPDASSSKPKEKK